MSVGSRVRVGDVWMYDDGGLVFVYLIVSLAKGDPREPRALVCHDPEANLERGIRCSQALPFHSSTSTMPSKLKLLYRVEHA